VTDVNHEVVDQHGTALKYGDNPNEAPQNVNGMTQLVAEFGDRYDHVYGSSRRSNWTCEKYGRSFPQVGFGSALFFRGDLDVIATGYDLLCDGLENVRPRLLQWIIYDKAGVRYLVAHFHGVWIKENTKGDHPARLVQSEEVLQRVAAAAEAHDVEKVVFGGDFNLDIKTEALKLLHDFDNSAQGPFRNLITEFGITDTRTTEYRKHNWPGESLYADYAFAGSNVSVTRFDVLNRVLASDHAPLLLEFI